MFARASRTGSAIETGTEDCAARWEMTSGRKVFATSTNASSAMSTSASWTSGGRFALVPVERSSTTSTSWTVRQQPVDDVGANEPCAARHQHSRHTLLLTVLRSYEGKPRSDAAKRVSARACNASRSAWPIFCGSWSQGASLEARGRTMTRRA